MREFKKAVIGAVCVGVLVCGIAYVVPAVRNAVEEDNQEVLAKSGELFEGTVTHREKSVKRNGTTYTLYYDVSGGDPDAKYRIVDEVVDKDQYVVMSEGSVVPVCISDGIVRSEFSFCGTDG